MSNTKDHNHEAITNGQRTASRKFRNTSKNLPVIAWTDLPLLGHLRDFSTVGKFQPVWRLQSDIQQSEQDSALTQLQQEHIEARATALGCSVSSSMREVNGVNVWYIAFVDATAMAVDNTPKDGGIEKTITLSPQQAAGMLKVEANAVAEAVALEPYINDEYVCATCGNVGKSHPITSMCFVCGADDWKPVSEEVGR